MRRDRRKTLVVVAAFGLASLTLADWARADDSTSLGQGGERARVSGETSGSRFDAGGWKHEWKAEPLLTHRNLVATPAMADGVVVFATQRNSVRAIDEIDGHLIWEAKAGSAILASPAIWHGLVFVFGIDQQLSALRLMDGALVWRKDLGAMGYASPTVIDGRLFVATGIPTPRLWQIDAATGATVWQAGQGVVQASALASVAVAGNHVLVSELEGATHSFALANGAWQWTARTGGRVALSSPLIVGDRVYLFPAGDQAQLHALDLATGAAIPGWPLSLPAPDVVSSHGPTRERRFVASSPAGLADAIVFSLRVEDRFGTDSQGDPQAFVAQELLFAVDGTNRRISWSAVTGRLESKNPNDIPSFEVLPTPALFRSGTGELLLAATSSLAPSVRVFARNGDLRWTGSLSAPTRSSPVLANGRLVVATDLGVVHSFLSASNQPPLAPADGFEPAADAASAAAVTTLRWGPAVDPEGEPLRFQVRIDDDGEILRDWDLEIAVPAGRRSATLPPLQEGAYTFAVRARDPQGAWSAWTAPQNFRAVGVPAVTVDGVAVASLADAVAVAPAGSTIRLGPGRFQLATTLHLPAGATLVGAGPHLTTLTGSGLPVAVAPRAGSQVRLLTVADAHVGVQVSGAAGVQLRNVILRDNDEAGLDVGADGNADLVSATVVGNGTGVRAAGATVVRNALVTANAVGLAAAQPGILTSGYNDTFANHVQDHRNVVAGPSDLSVPVEFGPGDPPNWHLLPAQATTDKGDPADDFGLEPVPNGARINIGAFGNTPFAELSGAGGVGSSDPEPDAGASDAGAAGAQGADAGAPVPAVDRGAGCGCRIGRTPGGEDSRSDGRGPALLLAAVLAGLVRSDRRRRRRGPRT